MPFVAGTVVLCQQGNLSPPGRTHWKENNRYALDLSNTSVPSLSVVAAAPGRVGYVYAGADPRDTTAGLGYGNHVKVEHGLGYLTMYAHLDRVDVHEGDVLEAGAPIGTVGFTGAAGNRHLHFSLHQGTPRGMGVYESTSMDALVTMSIASTAGFVATSSTDLRDGGLVLWDGELYGSENARGNNPLTGVPPPPLAALLETSRAALARAIADRKALDVVAHEWAERDRDWADGLIAPILARSPRHTVARYWHATAVLGGEKRWSDAEAIYRALLANDSMAEATWETWLISWCNNRLGVIASKSGKIDEARALFLEGARTATAEPERSFAQAALERLARGL